MTPDIVNIRHKRCQCGKARRSFGIAGDKAVFGKHCRTSVMVNAMNKCGLCDQAALCSFGIVSGKAVCCKDCKTPAMVDMVN